MKKVKLKNLKINDIAPFVELAQKVEEPGVLVHKGSTAIDGSSLMGMLALDTSNGIEVEYPTSAIDFDNFIKNLMGD